MDPSFTELYHDSQQYLWFYVSKQGVTCADLIAHTSCSKGAAYSQITG